MSIKKIYLIHHSHTDVGFTLEQPIVWEMYSRFIDEALYLAEKYQDHDTPGAFRWTIENLASLEYWLTHATDNEIDRLISLEKAGRVEIMGMFANITPLYNTDQIIESMQSLRLFRDDFGFTIEYAMNCDVNGQNWTLTDILLDFGIQGFSMAVNSHMGGPVTPRPSIFKWEAPSGRTILAANNWPYGKAGEEGIGRSKERFQERWKVMEAYLNDIGYPLPILLLQLIHPFDGDNATAYDYTPFIDDWNASNELQLEMVTPRTWWDAVREYEDLLPTMRGDWTDFWNFGAISSAHEQRLSTKSRKRLWSADAIYGALNQITDQQAWAHKSFRRHRDTAWYSLNCWGEHTWGVDLAIIQPDHDDTRTQWHHKADYAHKARSYSRLLQRDAIGDFAQHVTRENSDDILAFNPLPWKQTVAGLLPYFVTNPRGFPEDTTAGRHHQEREWTLPGNDDWWSPGRHYLLPATEIPAYGYAVIPRDQLVQLDEQWIGEDAIVSNHRYTITFDRETGGIVSLYDKSLDWELVKTDANYALNSYVHEEVADKSGVNDKTRMANARDMLFFQEWMSDKPEIPPGWKTGWHARRVGAYEVVKHKVYRQTHGLFIRQELHVKGVEGTLQQEVFLPDYAGYIECSAQWRMTSTSHPEATYLVFPFNVPDATARFDVGDQAVIAGEEQLPCVCRDYFTMQKWIDFNNGERGIMIATPENPLVQLGDFHYGHYQSEFSLEDATFLGWVTNNYWQTDFRPHQPGKVQARYRIQPYQGKFDEGKAHRFGTEALHTMPVCQKLTEPVTTDLPLPPEATLLNLPDAPVTVLHISKLPMKTASLFVYRMQVMKRGLRRSARDYSRLRQLRCVIC